VKLTNRLHLLQKLKMRGGTPPLLRMTAKPHANIGRHMPFSMRVEICLAAPKKKD
jgi:hypothetical protein